MKRLYTLFILVIGLTAIFSGPVYAAPAEIVETISVKILSQQTSPPPRVAKRMENSVRIIGEQLLAGRKIAEISDAKSSYEKLVKEVFDRVLVGYTVNRVKINPGAAAQIEIEVIPWGEVIRDVGLEIDYGSVSPEITRLLQRDIAGIEDKINDVLVGLPIDAVDWAGGITQNIVRELLAEKLPEFRSAFDITAGVKTQVRLTLLPVGPTVKDIKVALHSRTIPNILLLEARPALEEAAKSLRGLPVAFVERNQQFIQDKITAVAAAHPVTNRYGLAIYSAVKPGAETEISVDAETTKYKVWLEGYLDMGRKQDSTSAKLHIGQNIGKTDEAFVEAMFIPGTVSWRFMPGWGHKLGSNTETGFKYDLNQSHGMIWLQQSVVPKWSLRLERTPDINRNEIGIRYKIHEFISAEYIFTNDEKWLRLVGNL